VSTPEVTVVIASHERPLRLRWLLNSLEEQTLDPGRWDLIVVHDSAGERTQELLDTHPLTQAGRLKHIRRPPGMNPPGHQRNTGWRQATAPLIAFTDDDCRADPAWLEGLLAKAKENPGAIIQGKTGPDPFEENVWSAPHPRSVTTNPPELFVQACNVLYPKELLERVGGFDEAEPLQSGEDTDLALRAQEAGAPVVAALDARIYHCVESYSVTRMLKLNWKWRDLVRVVKRHPQVRDTLLLRVFWRPSHAWLLLALAGLAAARRHPVLALLAAPYLRGTLTTRGSGPAQLAAASVQLPGRVAVELGEIATMLVGSARHRALLI
jgi:glycosyltransferase involved in cell wall biosynthesis